MRELPGAEFLFQFGFDFEDDFGDRVDCRASSGVRWMRLERWSALSSWRGEVSELLQLADEVVERLFGHPGLGRELGGALVLGAGVLQHV